MSNLFSFSSNECMCWKQLLSFLQSQRNELGKLLPGIKSQFSSKYQRCLIQKYLRGVFHRREEILEIYSEDYINTGNSGVPEGAVWRIWRRPLYTQTEKYLAERWRKDKVQSHKCMNLENKEGYYKKSWLSHTLELNHRQSCPNVRFRNI